MAVERAGRLPPWRRTWVRVVSLAVAAVGTATLLVLLGAESMARRVQPLLRREVVDSLRQRFHERVELDDLRVSVAHGLQVEGRGLRLLPMGDAAALPVVKIEAFAFHVSVHALGRLQARVETIHVRGLEVHVPADAMQGAVPGAAQAAMRPPNAAREKDAGPRLIVGQVVVEDALLVIETDRPDKPPLEYRVANAVVKVEGEGRPFAFRAELPNPQPSGLIHAFGDFGPWDARSPRETPIRGDYTLAHADLGTIPGIRGTLDSTGTFTGVLGQLVVDGTTQTPDFALAGREHTLPLRTKFHAVVDGTTGDTTLAPLDATLGGSAFSAAGTVTRVALPADGPGSPVTAAQDVALTVTMPHGRIEDLLQLAVEADEPAMRGTMAMQAKLHVPPGKTSVADSLQMEGTVRVGDVTFTGKAMQDKVDGLSLRAQGRPGEARLASGDGVQQVASQLAARFAMADGMLKVESLQYSVPGAQVRMAGAVLLGSRRFSFDGHLLTAAKASQTVTGLKSQLLRPFNGVLAKDGAGMVLPISIEGVKGDYKVRLRDAGLTADEIADRMTRGDSTQGPGPAR